MEHREKEYVIFCDESDKKGPFYSNFYGGVIVGSSKLDQVNQRLLKAKETANIQSEIKWEKTSPFDLEGYMAMMRAYFDEIALGNIRTRIMFRQNTHVAADLEPEHHDNEYYILYYQFLKHAFGLAHMPIYSTGPNLRIYLDKLPQQTKEKVKQFRGHITALSANSKIRHTGITLLPENITEIDSKKHILLQCTDVVLGSMSFRLNNKHKAKAPGRRTRGKRTVAKEKLYKFILNEIRRVTNKPHFNIGTSTAVNEYPVGRWSDPYMHWSFVPKNREYDGTKTKRLKKYPTNST